MLREVTHEACVDAWVRRLDKVPSTHVLSCFQWALSGLWARALDTLGEITLAAIVDRVFVTASGRYPFLSSLKVDGAAIRFDELLELNHLSRERKLEASRFVLTEFLMVLGNLTAEILTPRLHEELSKTPTEKPDRQKGTQARSAIPNGDDGGCEGAPS